MKKFPLRKLLILIVLLAIALEFYAFAPSSEALWSRVDREMTAESRESKLVYMRADRSYSIDVGDSMAICMVGNFWALHNGAVITCDSAIRYDGQTVECFGNVLINQNTTFIYCDRADYQGRENKAEVYSPLVKVIDGDATLYTFKFSFNTYTKIGEFSGGGVLFNKGNQLESQRGYYFTDRHELACVGDVEMCDSTYTMISDSVVYNTDRDIAEFFLNTNIWNDNDDYLYGDRGRYDRTRECYSIYENGYILTAKDELWSDSLDYFREHEHAILHGNIQIDNTERKSMAFGDYGEYFAEPGNVLITRDAALVSYDLSQGDSLFMRSDTIMLLTNFTTRPEYNPWAVVVDSLKTSVDSISTDTLTADVKREVSLPSSDDEEEHSLQGIDVPQRETPRFGLDSMNRRGNRSHLDTVNTPRQRAASAVRGDSLNREDKDSLSSLDSMAADSLAADSLLDSARDSLKRLTDSLDTLSVKARKAYYKRVKKEQKAREKAIKEKARREKLAIIARARQAKITAQLNRLDSLEKVRLERRRARMQAKLEAKRERAIRKGKALPDSTALSELDSLLLERQKVDSMAMDRDSLQIDSLATDSLALDSIAVDSAAIKADTIRRIIRGYRNVRIFRNDFQAVCDSIVAIAADSTLHLYIDPVMWNEKNQLSSDVMDIYTKNQAVEYVTFVGRPIMVSMIDTAYYNQISGKEMTSWFRDNKIYRHDVNGNVETIYFMQDTPESPVNDMFVIKSGSASFNIEDNQVVTMTYREQNEYSMFPMGMRPENQPLFLKEYKWLPERRPARDSVMTREIRPSKREIKGELERPNFPISDKVIRYRDRLIETGRWADRDEELSPEVKEWVRRNGYEPSAPRKEFQ